MLDTNFINVTIPQQFDFGLFNINTEEDKLSFLQRMCDDSKNKPIMKEDEKVIGIVNYSTINPTNDGIVSYGTIWCSAGYELWNNENEFGFSSIVIKDRKRK